MKPKTLQVAVGLACLAITALAAPPPTNIVLIVADDLGFGDLGFHGSTQIPTPNIDRLAATGVVCAQGYVSSAVCSPSRAGLLSGRNQVEFGYDNNLGDNQPGYDPAYAGLPVGIPTIADRLQSAGYVTGVIGKWHLGTLPQFDPLRRGFSEFWGFLGGGHAYLPTVPAGQTEPLILCNYKQPAPVTYLTDDIGTECTDFVHRHRDQPFFLYAAFNAPHAPLQATADDLRRFDFIKDKRRRTYCAMVYRLDVNVGRILAAIDAAGLTDRTLIAFISDNGGPVDQNASLNAPLNGQKGILLEGGIRVPFILRWPGKLPPGQVFQSPVSSLDLAPTFLAAAGAPPSAFKGLEGLDLLPCLTGNEKPLPARTLRWRFTISAAIREGRWKLVRLPDRLPLLFDLDDDVSEQHDVALQNLDRTRAMLRELGDWDVRLPHPVFAEGAEWKARQLALYDAQYPLAQPVRTAAPVMKSQKETNSPAEH